MYEDRRGGEHMAKGKKRPAELPEYGTVILSILVDTFSSRILNPMLLPSGKRNIVVF